MFYNVNPTLKFDLGTHAFYIKLLNGQSVGPFSHQKYLKMHVDELHETTDPCVPFF